MFRYLRVKREPEKTPVEPAPQPIDLIAQDASRPIALRHINALPESARRRIYRALLPPELLAQFGIDPITCRGPDGDQHVRIKAELESGSMHISARKVPDFP